NGNEYRVWIAPASSATSVEKLKPGDSVRLYSWSFMLNRERTPNLSVPPGTSPVMAVGRCQVISKPSMAAPGSPIDFWPRPVSDSAHAGRPLSDNDTSENLKSASSLRCAP